MDEHVMAPARPSQFEAERLHKAPHVREGDIRDIAAGESREETPRVHGSTLPPRVDSPISRESRCAVCRGLAPRRSRLDALSAQLGSAVASACARTGPTPSTSA